ncbi:unnamed protein product [Closterium sp. NIES-54]
MGTRGFAAPSPAPPAAAFPAAAFSRASMLSIPPPPPPAGASSKPSPGAPSLARPVSPSRGTEGVDFMRYSGRMKCICGRGEE